MSAAKQIAAVITAELTRQVAETAGVMQNDVDLAFGADNAHLDGVFDLIKVGEALAASGLAAAPPAPWRVSGPAGSDGTDRCLYWVGPFRGRAFARFTKEDAVAIAEAVNSRGSRDDTGLEDLIGDAYQRLAAIVADLPDKEAARFTDLLDILCDPYAQAAGSGVPK